MGTGRGGLLLKTSPLLGLRTPAGAHSEPRGEAPRPAHPPTHKGFGKETKNNEPRRTEGGGGGLRTLIFHPSPFWGHSLGLIIKVDPFFKRRQRLNAAVSDNLPHTLSAK